MWGGGGGGGGGERVGTEIDCVFQSFSTVFQSYQYHGWVIIAGCLQWNPVYVCVCKDSCIKRGSNPELQDQQTSA